ncbi:hypothetical protein BDV12DRAFT_173516 [Aspergillus spectabilis]
MTQPQTQSTATPEAQSMPPSLPRAVLQTLFTSLTRTPKSTTTTPPPQTRWTLLRTLKSENPNDIQGDLHGTAIFTPLRRPTTTNPSDTDTGYKELLYSEEGSLPQSFGPGLRWTKKYIWRLSPEGKISIWFVKLDSRNNEGEEEADYLFHEFDFGSSITGHTSEENSSSGGEEFVSPPVPPETGIGSLCETGTGTGTGTVVAARGNHLCINDMYRTAYAFRVEEGSGEVLGWASRHVVRGPKKGQDIVNLYSRSL